MDKVLTAGLVILGALVLIFILSLLSAWPVMLLWNWVAVDLFHAPVISFWQAWGLTMLCSLLFKASTSSSSKKS